jgi:hypothetical protein
MIFVVEGLDVVLVGFQVLRRHDDCLAGESVAKCVQRGALFALGSAGAGGVLGVGAIGFEAEFVVHFEFLPFCC